MRKIRIYIEILSTRTYSCNFYLQFTNLRSAGPIVIINIRNLETTN